MGKCFLVFPLMSPNSAPQPLVSFLMNSKLLLVAKVSSVCQFLLPVLAMACLCGKDAEFYLNLVFSEVCYS